MKKLQKQAFTLVELIVVITILAILWTIAFISYQNYSKNARDGARIADINNIEKSLWIFITEKWFYPIPDYGSHITYSWALARTQWTVWDNVITNLRNLSKKPVDPLTWDEYTYSVANNNVEYQVATILEWWSLTYNLPLLTKQANAATTKIATAKVKWTYNEKILQVSTWGLNYILAVPSIINSNINHVDLQDLITNKELVYNDYSNIPDSYRNSWYTMTGWFEFLPPLNNIVVYTWSLTDLSSSGTIQQQFVTDLQTIYNWTIIESEAWIQEILNATTPEQQQQLVCYYVFKWRDCVLLSTLPITPSLPEIPTVCSLTQTQVNTLSWFLSTGDLYAYDIDRNELSSLTESDWCNNVKSIDWVWWTDIPAEIWNLTNLNELHLSRNSLTSLPSEIWNLTNLTTLDLYHNSLTNLPPEISNLSNLTYLRLSENSLTSLPSEILNLTNLTDLDLDTNSLTSLPSEIWNLTNLTNLILAHNSLMSLPSEIWNLTNLTVLDLSNNSLTSIPIEIWELINLTNLELLSNSLSSLPVEIWSLINLTSLNLGFNSLQNIPSSIWSLINLTSLNLRNNSLSSLPVEIWSLINLNELYLMYNSLSSLPVEIWSLTNLTRVYFDNNLLQSIPSSIWNLINLTVLDLLHNSLTTLPSEIWSLANLNELYLNNNNLLWTLSTDFLNYIPKSKSQYGIPTTWKTMTISANWTKIVITVTVTPQ